MNPKITVAVACYNHENYIEECLRSIFTQTHQNIELLVFNDGSTDNSDSIIERTLQESPFETTLYFSEKNQGVAKVRNEAIEKMTGEFIIFMDSDNFMPAKHLEILLEKLQSTNADIAYCQLWDFKNQRDVLRSDLEYSLEKELNGNLIDVSSLVRSTIIKSITFDEELENLEDFDFWLNAILNHHAKPLYVSETKLNYRVLDNSRSARENWEQYYKSYFYILNKYQNEIPTQIINALQGNIMYWIKKNNDQALHYQKAILDKDRHIEDQEKFIIQALKDKDTYISSQERALEQFKRELEEIRHSRAYRLGRKILHPFRKER